MQSLTQSRFYMTRHASIRKNQRGFTEFSLDIIRKYGRPVSSRDGAVKYFFGNKEYQEAVQDLKRTIQLMDRAKNGSVIVKEDRVLTVYK